MNKSINPVKSLVSKLIEGIKRPYSNLHKGKIWRARPETDYREPLYTGRGRWIDRTITNYIDVGVTEVFVEIGAEDWREIHAFIIDDIDYDTSNQKVFTGTCDDKSYKSRYGLNGHVKNGDICIFGIKDITKISVSHYTNVCLLPHVLYVPTPDQLPSYFYD